MFSAITKMFRKVPDAPEFSIERLGRIAAGADYYALITKSEKPRSELLNKAENFLTYRPGAYDKISDSMSLAGGRGLDGVDIHLGTMHDRLPGHLLSQWDSGRGVFCDSMPDGCARSVYVHKSDDLARDWGAFTRQAERILQPGGLLILRGARDIPVVDKIAKNLSVIEPPSDFPPGLTVIQKAEMPAKDVKEAEKAPDATTDKLGKPASDGPETIHLDALSDIQKQRITKAIGAETAPAVGVSPMRQIVYGVVLEPDTFDAQDDTISPEEIEKAAHSFLSESRVIGSEHAGEIAAVPVESFVAPQDLQFNDPVYGQQIVRKGSWVLGMKIRDPGQWQKVINGEYAGFSVGGFGLRHPLP